VKLVTAPSLLVTRNVALGSGAAVGISDPFLIAPGRIGVTMITPVIPVFSVFDSLRANAHTTRNNKLMVTTRRHILLHLISRKLLFKPKYFLWMVARLCHRLARVGRASEPGLREIILFYAARPRAREDHSESHHHHAAPASHSGEGGWLAPETAKFKHAF